MDRWKCRTCDKWHEGLPAVTVNAPIYWDQASGLEREQEFELTSDTCVWKGEFYFVRSTLRLPLFDALGTLDFGIWASLSKPNFGHYMEMFEAPNRIDIKPMFGWLSNSLPGFPETLNLPCNVVVQPVIFRPQIVLRPGDHPLIAMQQEGISGHIAAAYVRDHLGI